MMVPRMADRASGSVIVISSIGEKVGNKTIGVYNISKTANSQLVRNLAVEWGAQNVLANCIAPGLIKTDRARALWESTTIRQFVEDHTPLERIGTTDNVVAVAVFLASPAAAFVTGQTLVVGGGFTIAELVG